MTKNRHRDADKPPVPTMVAVDLSDNAVLKKIPAAYLRALQDNPDLNACCRDVTQQYTYQAFKTDDALEKPNLAVFTCTACGRKHYRGAIGPGKL